MNILNEAACLNESWKDYWRVANVPYEINSTWVQDLYIASVFSWTSIKITIDDAVTNWKTDFHMFTQLIIAVNFLAWHFCGKNREYTNFFSEEYYRLIDIAEENFTADELEEFYKLID